MRAGACRLQPDEQRDNLRVAAQFAGRGGDVRCPDEPQEADGDVAQAGHDPRAVAAADLGAILVVGPVADVVKAVSICQWPRFSSSRRAASAFPGWRLVTPKRRSTVLLRPRTRPPARLVVMRSMQKTWPTDGKSRYSLSSVLVQMRRISIRPWPFSTVACSGGKSLRLRRLTRGVLAS